MGRRTLAIVAFGAGAGLVIACLPELSALKGADAAGTDGGDETSTVAPIRPCGDGFIDEDAGEECDPGDASTSCVDCKVVCPGGVKDDASLHCYAVANEQTTFANAVSSCTGGHVVTIGSEREAALVDSIATAPYWVGASYQGALAGFGATVATEPGFPRDGGCTGCFARTIVAPADGGGGDCVVAADEGWTISSCFDASAATVCEREPGGTRSFYCQGPYCSTINGTTKRYLVYLKGQERTGAEAAAVCSQFEGGRLVVFESREERERVVQEVLRLGVDTPFEAWIGLANVGGTWTWDDGVVADDGGRPAPWGADQPNTNAGRAFMRINPAFYDSQLAQAKDDVARAFICERK